jgi:NitT/TauT family transport system ATP-binding protein
MAESGASEGVEPPSGSVALELRKVTRAYATRRGVSVPALGSVDLSFEAGEFVAIVGPSGCGKTTLLKIVGGLARPTSGDVFYQGKRVTSPVPDLGIVFQRAVLLEWRTVLRNVTMQAEIRHLGTPVERATWAHELLDRVGLVGCEDRYPWELSGGQQQRVSLCRALIHRPGLLLMDEPFGALDALTREQLQRDVERLWMAQQPTVLFVTHDVGEAVSLADRVIVLTGRPGIVTEDIRVDGKRPRGGALLERPELQAYARQVRAVLEPASDSSAKPMTQRDP